MPMIPGAQSRHPRVCQLVKYSGRHRARDWRATSQNYFVFPGKYCDESRNSIAILI